MLTSHPAAAIAVLGSLAFLLGPAYILWLRARRPGRESEPADPSVWPAVDVIVPVHDEASGIAGKIGDLRELDYPPGRLRIRIVDGASTDGTPERAAEAIAGDRRFVVQPAGVADKTGQINLALASCASAWVLVTDADARLAPDTLRRLVRKGESDPRVGAVGATVRPAGALPSERLHWNFADGLRRLEGERGAASIVTGPCYLFRRAIVPSLPSDVVADDVHVAFRSAAAGRRVAFISADVTELRNPDSLPEMLRHKFRKGHAYLREVFRFLPAVGAMPPRARAVFLWRAAQMILAPPTAVLLAAALLCNLDAAGPWGWAVAAAGPVVLLSGRRGRATAGLAAVLALALLAASLSLPFFRQRASFRKIGAGRGRVPEPAAS